MARIRSVKPEICESETMARLTAAEERTFVRLWTHCDDHGRAKDHPVLLKAALFPLHDDVTAETIDEHLEACRREGLIHRYSVSGKRFLEVVNWHEHQKPQKPRASKLPAWSDADPVEVRDTNGTPTDTVPNASSPVVEGSGGVEVVGVGDTPTSCEDYTDSTEPDPPRPVVDQPTLRRAIRLVADVQARGGRDPGALAASIRVRLGSDPDDPERQRIDELLAAGKSPEDIAASWITTAPDPLLGGFVGRPVAEPPRPPLTEFRGFDHDDAAPADVARSVIAAARGRTEP